MLKDGDYATWELALAARYPLALSEMRVPSVPLGRMETEPLARWGIECGTGWRPIIERLLERLEAEIARESVDQRDGYRIVQLKEKFGGLRVYLAHPGTAEMEAAIADASRECTRTCDVCGAPGVLAERDDWYAVRCGAHERWTPWDDRQ